MTQDEITDIYKEVSNKLCGGKEWCWAGVGEPLQLFAKLVAQEVRDRIMFGSRDDWVLAEREACAQIAERLSDIDLEHNFSALIAHNIRARGEQA